jgi:hypothetical protein
MGNTVVTLTGDDANLFKAYQRIIAKEVEMRDKLKGVGEESKKTKTGLEALAATDFNGVNDSMAKLGDTSSITGGISTNTFMKMASSVNVYQLAVDGVMFSVQAAISQFKDLQRIGDESLARTERTAVGQQEAAKNLISLTPEEFRDVQERVVPQIQRETSFVDRGALSQAFGEVQSITGNMDQTTELVRESAKMNLQTPDKLVETASSLSDMTRDLGITVREAVAMLASSQLVFRAPDQKVVARGIAQVSTQAIGLSPGIPKVELSNQAASLLSVIGKNDDRGDSSITATQTFLDQLRTPFTDQARVERDDSFSKLSRQRDLEIERQRQLELEIRRADAKASTFAKTDSTPKADIARNEAAKARRDLERSKADLTRTENEMARISRLQAVQVSDPITPIGRLDAIAASPDLRAETISKLTGEVAFRDEMRELLTPNSELRKKLEENRNTITVKPVASDRLNELLTSTDALRVGKLKNESEVARDQYDDGPLRHLQTSNEIRKIRDETLARQPAPYNPRNILLPVGGTAANLSDAVTGNDPEDVARDAIQRLRLEGRRADRLNTPDAKPFVEFVREQISRIEKQVDLFRTAKPAVPVELMNAETTQMPTPPATATLPPMIVADVRSDAVPTPSETTRIPTPPTTATLPPMIVADVRSDAVPTPSETTRIPTPPATALTERIRPELPAIERREAPTTPPKQDSSVLLDLKSELQAGNELMRQQNALLRDSRPENRPNPPPNPALIIPQQSLRGN